MKILIDAGNTRIKLDWLQTGTQRRASRVLAFTADEPDAARRWLAELPQPPFSAIGVNVAGPSTAALLASLLECPIQWLLPGPGALDVRNGYGEPRQLGADRWAAMLGLAWHERTRRAAAAGAGAETAARQRAGAEPGAEGRACALLAIFGTATTVDTLRPVADEDGQAGAASFDFPGGLIFPGPEMMLSALSAGTANLPHGWGDTALYPAHTRQAIATGVAAAQAGAVLRQWLAGLDLRGVPPEVYVSGGGWPLVCDEVQRLLDAARGRLGLPLQPLHWLEAPVLDGLARMAATAL